MKSFLSPVMMLVLAAGVVLIPFAGADLNQARSAPPPKKVPVVKKAPRVNSHELTQKHPRVRAILRAMPHHHPVRLHEEISHRKKRIKEREDLHKLGKVAAIESHLHKKHHHPHSSVHRITVIAHKRGITLAGPNSGPGTAVQNGSLRVSNDVLVNAHYYLHCVRLTLQSADHDYGGHRAAAVRDVEAAGDQIRQALQHPPKGFASPRFFPIPQVLSDAMLANSIPALLNANALLRASTHDYGGHRAKAVADTRKAIAELEKALEYSAVHNWGGDYHAFSRTQPATAGSVGSGGARPGGVRTARVGSVVVSTRHPLKTHLRVRAILRANPHHHHVRLHEEISHRRKRIIEREAVSKLKRTAATHHFVKKHLPPRHSSVAKIKAIVHHHRATNAVRKPPPPRKK